ncbi:MAG: hypothetical protein IKA65_03315 [Lentisphaeria bacterium]|nr:hypothetical protein [Lentisphaeria bacterium]
MAKKSNLELIVQILLLAAVVFFGISITKALDRNRQATAALHKELEAMKQGFSAPQKTAVLPTAETSELAQYFPDSSIAVSGELRTAIASDVGSLNPVTGNEAAAQSIIGMCTAPLGARSFARPEKFVPLIAETWSVSPDGKTINIKLRKNVLWQSFTDPESGKFVPEKPVTAHDFVFYVNVIRDPGVNAGALRSYFQDLESIRSKGDYELELVWKNEYFRMLEMSLGLIPLPRHFYMPNGKFDAAKFNDDYKRNDMIVGCGPYKLVKHIKDQRFILERFDNYFGNALGIAPRIRKRVLEVVKADNTRLQMLLSGKLDMLSISAEQWVKRANRKPFAAKVMTTGSKSAEHPLQPGEKFRRVKHLANAYFYIGYNQRCELFTDRRVRRAMTMLCNRERILKEVYHGQGKVISGPFFYDSPYYDKSVKPLPFAPENAVKLLKQAGWQDRDGDGILDKDGRKFVFTALQVSGNPVQEKILSIFKEDLAAAGIDMKIVTLEWPVYINKLDKKDYEVCSLGWQLPFESDPYQVWHSSQAAGANGSNHISFINPRADKLIEEIRRTGDVKKRIKLCREFHKLIHEEQPYTFLAVPESLQVISGKIGNVECFPLGLNSECFYIE